MKTFLVFTVFLLFLSSCKHDNVRHNNAVLSKYIEIRHTGRSEKYIKPLIISIKKVDFKVDRSDVTFLDPNKPLTPEIKESYLNVNYDFIITDTMTYQSIVNFVDKNQDLFTNGINKNYGDEADYSITVNGKMYEIFYQLKYLFFLKLRLYLQMQSGDKALIKKLEYY